MKTYALSVINQINQRCRHLVGELQAICNAKRRQLNQKSTEIRLLSDNLQHGLRFAEYLLTLTEDASLLYSRRTLMHQLSAILRTRCEVPNPYHVVDLRFSPNPMPSTNLSLGCLVVDGYQYGSRGQTVPSTASAAANGRVTSSSPHSGYFSGSSAAAGEPLNGDQKMQKLQMMLQMRMRMDRQRILPRHSAASGSPMNASDYPTGGGIVSGTPSYMPNQSSNISSSNQHRWEATGSAGIAPPAYVAPAHPHKYPSMHNSSLAHLQEQLHLQNHHEHVTTTLQPIVIQPTNLPDQSWFYISFPHQLFFCSLSVFGSPVNSWDRRFFFWCPFFVT